MHSWDSLTIAEQTLMRRAFLGYSLAGLVQNYGVALRWAGAAEAPPLRSFTGDEQRALVPQLAGVALDLAERGLLTVHEHEERLSQGLSRLVTRALAATGRRPAVPTEDLTRLLVALSEGLTALQLIQSTRDHAVQGLCRRLTPYLIQALTESATENDSTSD
ncbi:hypothetical protein GXW83_17505 [Streptacidiphilus sp. PB12-B1b]|uniref:hypothetical protein n=1 Tax=Streptacidiphilus sp. PB12-B1b TaxID=2705012 RepID=UPI0015F93E3A|nr:hypothetical protein [Streptacidiphilus sp. PB12-B1b]QMU77234.1 hypothetical protein GXW83_17505 [Streptacidiphilus sp. PB12-B1b]